MNTTRDPEAILLAWLDEGPTELPGATRRAILTSLPTTPQARRGPLAPWRFSLMNTYTRLAAAAVVAVLAMGGALYLIGPRFGVGGPSPLPSTTPATTLQPTPAAGTITLTDTGCSWDGNPGTLSRPDRVQLRLRNDTDRYGDFQLHWVRTGHTYEDGVAFVAELSRRLTTGEDWPPNDISIAVAGLGVNARSEALASWPTAGSGDAPAPELQHGVNWSWETGDYGIVCSANTSPTGDVLTTFLAGPLHISFLLAGTDASPVPSASP